MNDLAATTSNHWLSNYQDAINTYLDERLPRADIHDSSQLCEAMRYAVLNGGKRLRPAIVYAVGDDLGISIDKLHPAAAAIELMHCYSLVHDDLPAMDNDDLRRGKLTCHKAFDEATAILAGNALQSLAFELLSAQTKPYSLKMIHELSTLTGYQGTMGGQALDLAAEKDTPSLRQLETIHLLKTAALIEASIILGAIPSETLSQGDLLTLKKVGKLIGLSFQIQDDILDLTSSTSSLGKQVHADIVQNKATYPRLTTLTRSEKKAAELFDEAEILLNQLPYHMTELRKIISHIKNRES
ncbi:MAG: geranyl transferase [Coxiellaceae bacterium]|nr:geranyl transferase [Coxiellaceae bacterium]|tara:strand:+ start:2413 stop:3309 length:897 start_codon:yes stop_codon:yes gene_type:complete